MTKSTIFYLVVTLIIGILIGRYFLPNTVQSIPASSDITAVVSDNQSSSTDTVGIDYQPVNRETSSAGSSLDKPLETAVDKEQLFSLLKQSEGRFNFSLKIKAYELASSLSAEELKDVITQMFDGSDKGLGNINLMIDALANHGTLEALDFVNRNPLFDNRNRLSDGLISRLAKEDPYAAYSYLLEAGPTNYSFSAATVIAELSATTSPSELLSMAQNLIQANADQPQSLDAGRMSIHGLVRGAMGQQNKLFELYHLMNNSNDISDNHKELYINSWSQADPESFMHAIDNGDLGDWQIESNSNSFLNTFLLQPSNTGTPQVDIERKADWIMSKVPAENKDYYLTTIAQRMLRYNDYEDSMQTAFDWVERQEPDNIEAANQRILDGVVFQNPALAIKNLDKLKTEQALVSISFKIYISMKRLSTEKANEFIANSPHREILESRIEQMEQARKRHSGTN